MKAVPLQPLPSSSVIETLETYLARARRGEIRAIFLTAIVIDGDGEGSVYEVSTGKRVWRDALLGAVERAKFVCLERWTRD